MKKSINFLKILMAVCCPLVLSAQSDFMAGAAKINITPDQPIRMSGYGGRDEPFSGIHDSIYATALVLENGTERIALVAVDVIGFSHNFVDETRQLIFTSTQIKPEQILIIAAHNHGGPVTSVYTRESTENEEAYYKGLKSKINKVVQDALKKVAPAKVGAGKGTCRMNINRRAHHADGGIWLGRNPDGPCDHEVAIIRIDDLENNPMAAFLNWPCHATVSGPDNTQITGDWPGAAARYFTQNTNTLLMATAGASADINPIYGPNSKFNDIEAIGQLVGQEAVNVFNNIQTEIPAEIKMEQAILPAKGKKRGESRMPNVSLESDEDQMIRLSGCKIGSILLAGISGELMTEIGMQIKESSPYKNTFVITHCNGSNGYLCTDSAYKEGGYEPMVSKTMPGTADAILLIFRQLFQKM
ncbi:MAG: neutral/alkaline non-lysosomal ceramidase N-terminal domain-containing protein [Saprospiraceae bacterium]|nr:neutral/alkaline non-lysosomal ceramidase N-terminal domain-containing protein [Saprospiraceae bacterium]